MSPPSLQRLRSPMWRYALLAGLASYPLTLALHWREPSGPWDASGIALCALVTGYVVNRRGLESTPVGVRAGVVGAVPVLVSVADVVPFVLELAQPAWFTVGQLALLVGAASVLVGATALVGGVAGRLGGWLAGQRGSPRHAADG